MNVISVPNWPCAFDEQPKVATNDRRLHFYCAHIFRAKRVRVGIIFSSCLFLFFFCSDIFSLVPKYNFIMRFAAAWRWRTWNFHKMLGQSCLRCHFVLLALYRRAPCCTTLTTIYAARSRGSTACMTCCSCCIDLSDFFLFGMHFARCRLFLLAFFSSGNGHANKQDGPTLLNAGLQFSGRQHETSVLGSSAVYAFNRVPHPQRSAATQCNSKIYCRQRQMEVKWLRAFSHAPRSI